MAMGPTHRRTTATHLIMANPTNALEHIEFKSILKSSHMTYYPPIPPIPTIPSHDTSPESAMPRHIPLPQFQPDSIMFTMERPTKDRACELNRVSSISSMRRSVTGMKQLLPLKLSSANRSEQEWPSPTSSHRSTFGFSVRSSPSLFERRAKQKNVPPPMSIRPRKYRDTPIYTEAGSPMMCRAYYTDEEVCFGCSPGNSSCDESFTFHDYDSSSDESHRCGEWLRSVPEGIVGGGSRPSTGSFDGTRDSDMSFKCRGEYQSAETPLFRDEAAWLSSSSPVRSLSNARSDEFAKVPALGHGAEGGWLDDASSYDGDDDDILECATALAASKAQVVDLNINYTNGLTFSIPPRSSSFAGTRPDSFLTDLGRKSRMSFRESLSHVGDLHHRSDYNSDNDFTPTGRQFNTASSSSFPGGRIDLARTTPPLSPKMIPTSRWSANSSSPRRTARDSKESQPFTNHRSSSTTQSDTATDSDFALDIITTLEEATVNFPSTLIFSDAPCVMLLRSCTRHSFSTQTSHSNSDTSIHPHSSPLSEPSCPIPSSNSTGLNRRKTTTFLGHRYKPSISLERLDIQSFIPEMPPSPFGARNFTYPASNPRSSSISSLKQPNMGALMNIFPGAEGYLLDALYAYVTAHNYLSSLFSPPPHPSSSKSSNLSSSRHNSNSSHPSHNTNSISSDPFDSAGMPFFTTATYNLPSKVASVLGVPPMAARPALPHRAGGGGDRMVLRTSDGGLGRVEALRERVRGCVGWLVGELNGVGREGRGLGTDSEVDDVLLRALGEIVGAM